MNILHFTDNQNINLWINYCLSLLDSEDVPKFIKSFKNYSSKDQQSLHVFRELILGAYLRSNGIKVRNNFKISNKTPDWTVIDNAMNYKCIIELVNLDIDTRTNKYMEQQRCNNRVAVYWIGDNKNRLYQALLNKKSKYKDVLSQYDLPYVVAIFVDFRLHFDKDEINDMLNNKQDGLFLEAENLSGLLYISDSNGKYDFIYFKNDIAKNMYQLPSGEFNIRI